MRIVVHEFVSGGGLAGQEVPASLAREGAAMHAALIADLAALDSHRIVTTADPRFPIPRPSGVEAVNLSPTATVRDKQLDTLIGSADAAWFVAPETADCLAGLAARAERQGKAVLGPGSAAIRRASDKGSISGRLIRHGISCPQTLVLKPGADWSLWKSAARTLGYPVVVKPRRGAGCNGVCLAPDARALRRGVEIATRANGKGSLVLQRFVAGVPASVSLLAAGRRALPLTVNGQSMAVSGSFRYHGGTTPLDHPGARRAIEAALRACEALRGLYGYVGVDLVLTGSEAVVIEVNPRLTTAYLGVRAAVEGNVAALALDACAGTLPDSVNVRQRVSFAADGRILSAVAI